MARELAKGQPVIHIARDDKRMEAMRAALAFMAPDALVLDFEPIDTLHHTFVDLLAHAQQAPDDDLPQAWTALVDHTMAQFEWEDDCMQRTGFSSAANHSLQHRVVLNLLREGLAKARSGQLAAVREMAFELAAAAAFREAARQAKAQVLEPVMAVEIEGAETFSLSAASVMDPAWPTAARCSRPGPPRPLSAAYSPTRLSASHARTSARNSSTVITLVG